MGRYALENENMGLLGAVSSTQMTISGSQTLSEKLPPTPLSRRKTLLVYNYNTETADVLFVGASGIDIAENIGIPIKPGNGISLDLSRSELWAFVPATTSGIDVRLLEIA